MKKAPIRYNRARKLYFLEFERGGKRYNLGTHENKTVLERRYAAWMTAHHMDMSNLWFDAEAKLAEEIEQQEGESRDTSTLGEIYWDAEENMYVRETA